MTDSLFMKKGAEIVAVVCTILILVACSMSKNDTEVAVRKGVEKELARDGHSELTVGSVRLTKKNKNQYVGIITYLHQETGLTEEAAVEAITDRDSVNYNYARPSRILRDVLVKKLCGKRWIGREGSLTFKENGMVLRSLEGIDGEYGYAVNDDHTIRVDWPYASRAYTQFVNSFSGMPGVPFYGSSGGPSTYTVTVTEDTLLMRDKRHGLEHLYDAEGVREGDRVRP